MDKSLEEFVKEHIEKVEKIAEGYSKFMELDYDDLKSYAYEGLIHAYNHYNPEKNKEIDSYLFSCVQGMILSGVPEVKGYNDRYTYWKNSELINSREEIDFSFLPEDLQNYLLLYNTTSLDQLCEQGDLTYLEELSQTEEEDYHYRELKDELLKALNQLTTRQKMVIIEKYGLNDESPKTLGQLANIYGVTKWKIIQIEKKALKKLRQNIINHHLMEYLSDDHRINGSNPSTIVGRSIC